MIVDLLRDKDLTDKTQERVNGVAKDVQELRGAQAEVYTC